jgi:hypothetical protein
MISSSQEWMGTKLVQGKTPQIVANECKRENDLDTLYRDARIPGVDPTTNNLGEREPRQQVGPTQCPRERALYKI